MGHLQFVTGMTCRQARRHVADAFGLWEVRSRTGWQLDLSVISDAGVSLREEGSGAH